MFRDAVEAAVRLGVVPALLVLGVVAAGVSAGQVLPKARAAAYGGFWAGFLASVALVLGLRGLTVGTLPGWIAWLPAPAALVVGLGAGPVNTVLYLAFRDSRLVAVPLGCQAFGALGLFYVFWALPPFQDHIAWTAVGIASASTAFYAFGRDRWPRIETSERRRERRKERAKQRRDRRAAVPGSPVTGYWSGARYIGPPTAIDNATATPGPVS